MPLHSVMCAEDPTLPRHGTDAMPLNCVMCEATRRYRVTLLTSLRSVMREETRRYRVTVLTPDHSV
ncbi:MAG TPA: hypothetical protein VMM84_03185 [Pyrinomonadaceae bacterium]|nr:hypothetical protein [Pyrinomonadaceae bacterium]